MRAGMASIVVMAVAGAAAAQAPDGVARRRSDSHIEIPSTDDRNPDKLFMDRLKQLKSQSDLSSLLQPGRGLGGSFDLARFQRMVQENPELLERARQLLHGIDLSDPKVRSMIDDFVRQFRSNVNSEQVLRQLQELQNQRNGGSGGGGEAGAMLIPKNREQQRPSILNGETDENGGRWTRDIMNWAERFPKDRLGSALRDSPALRDFMKDLAKGVRFGSLRDGDTLDKQMARWQDRWESLKSWLPDEWPGGFRPNLDGLRSVDVRMPRIEFNASDSARSAAPALSRVADALPVLYVAIGVLIAMALWRMVRARIAARSASAAGDLPPVPLEQVDSRRQLIRAFDQLAVWRCGVPARSWNHRTVARNLPRGDGDLSAVVALADAYEWARYSPEPGEPSADFLAAARRNLAALREGAA